MTAERLVALLRRLEWCATVQGDEDRCPVCDASKYPMDLRIDQESVDPAMNRGTHKAGCELAALLRELTHGPE